MKNLMTFFSVLLISTSVLAQSSTLGTGLNIPVGTGNGVGSPPNYNNAPPADTPSLNQSTVNDGINNNNFPSSSEVQKMEDTSNFNNGAYGGSLGGSGMGTQNSNSIGPGLGNGVGTPAGTDTGPGLGVPSPIQ